MTTSPELMLNPAQESISAMLRDSLGGRAASAFEAKMEAWNTSRPKPVLSGRQLRVLRYIAMNGLPAVAEMAERQLEEYGGA